MSKSQVKKDQAEVESVYADIVKEGIDEITAAKYALMAYPKASKAFVEKLSDGKLTKDKGQVVEVVAA